MADRPPLIVLVNRAGGTAAAAGDRLQEQLDAAFAGTGAEVRLIAPDEMPQAVREAAAAGKRIIVGGGDGTINCAAQALSDVANVEIGLLPLGTLNHLARDLAIPNELEEAAVLAVRGTATAVDVASVNGRRFVNNASVGLYPFMVRRRDDARERTGMPKWLATVPAAWAALARLPHHRVQIDMGEGPKPLVTSLLFVGNNRYELGGGSVGSRQTIDDGVLSVFAVAHRNRLALAWFALRTLLGRADRNRDFTAIGECTTLTVASTGRSIEIALDGEVLRLESPLTFRVERGALNIVAPPPVVR
jgi:diacylglycerol kinase family enzyme